MKSGGERDLFLKRGTDLWRSNDFWRRDRVNSEVVGTSEEVKIRKEKRLGFMSC